MMGQCRLCLLSKDLQDSHIIPKWAYKKIRKSSKASNPNPVEIDNGRAVQTSKQVTEYLLCWDCEQLLGTSEQYVSKLVYQDDGSVPILQNLGSRSTDQATGYTVADASCLDHEAITHFAASVIWRSHVSSTTNRATLGTKYGEVFRKHVFKQEAFPESAGLWVFVFEPSEKLKCQSLVAFPATINDSGFHRHSFVVCGLYFEICVGNELPEHVEHTCFSRSRGRYLFIAPAHDFGRVKGVIAEAKAAKSSKGSAGSRR